MQLSAEEIEQRYHRTIREQSRARNAARFAGPEGDDTLEKVWVVYVWAADPDDATKGEWILAGFRRRRNRRKPQTMNRFFSKVRRKLGVDKSSPVTLVDLDEAKRRIDSPDQSWKYRRPQFQARKAKVKITKPALLTRKTPKIRAKQRAKLFNKNTKFVVIGRNVWDREPGYLYLGPLESTQKRLAQFEAKRLFPVYNERIVIAAGDLSKPLRGAMTRSKRVRAGVTRIEWPEPRPSFDDVWAKVVKAGKVEEQSALRTPIHDQWVADGSPWLTRSWIIRQVKQRTPAKTRVVWMNRKYHCVKCKGHGSTPSTIEHASPLCVPIPEQENAACAATVKQIAKRNADKLRKRKDRRIARKTAAEKAKGRKRAAKKAARTRAKKKATMLNSQKKSCVQPKSARPLGTLRIVAILRNVLHRR